MAQQGQAQDGLVSAPSKYSALETTDRLLAALAKRSMTVFGRVDHAAGAANAGLCRERPR